MTADEIEVEPAKVGGYAIVRTGDVEIVAEGAHVDEKDRLALRAHNRTIARIETALPPLDVPNLVRRAAEYDEPASWPTEDVGPRAVPDRGERVTWTSPNGTEMEAHASRVKGLDPDEKTYVVTDEGDGVPLDWLDGFGTDEADR